MNYPDDYTSAPSQFHGDETGDVFAVQDIERTKFESFEQNFETQSGFLVLVKPVGNRYSLSFKRKVGTPPSSSVFLTPDEAKRLANILKPEMGSGNESVDALEINETTAAFINLLKPVKSKQSRIAETMVAFLGTIILCAVVAMIVFELKHSH